MKIPHIRRRRRRHIDKAERWKTLLVIALCILAAVLIILGMRYDKTRWVKPVSLGTNSLYFPAPFEGQSAFTNDA